MDDKDIRKKYDPCTLGAETGPQNIIVRQVIGEAEKQKVLDIHVVVPPEKPAIEQIIDVFVKDVEINCVDVIFDKIIVRGEFEIKVIYVADLPNNPVHAIEIKHYRWTQDMDMPGARRGMDADASVFVEFVDYDVDEWSRAYKYKYGEMDNNDCDNDHDHDHDHDHGGHNCHDPHNCNDHKKKHHKHHHHCSREFDISIVLKIIGKVIADREVQIGGMGTLPTTPKG